MYQDFYLQFADEEQAKSVLLTVQPAQLEADGVTLSEESSTPNYQNIDVLGTLHQKPPADAPEDYVPVAVPGYHVNVRCMPDEDSAALEPFKVNPEPKAWRRVWG